MPSSLIQGVLFRIARDTPPIAAELPDISATVRIWSTSEGRDPSALIPGGDVALHAPRAHGDSLPHGTLLDDWLDYATRERVDRRARSLLASWRERRDALLTVDGVCLPWVHEQELYSDAFLRETRVVEGLRALVDAGARHLTLRGADPALAACIEQALSPAGASVELIEPGAPPSYPIAFRAAGVRTPLISRARESTGIPARPRGAVLVEPYWHLTTLCGRLAAEGATLPVLNPVNPPALSAPELLGLAWRGGWIGSPSAGARRRSRRSVATALASLTAGAAPEGLERLFDLRAARLLGRAAGDTPAELSLRRRAFRGSRIRAVLAYSDTVPVPRINALAAREHGARVVLIQHGLQAYLPREEDGRPARVIDGWVADVIGAWTDADASALAPHVSGTFEVTGNPGAARLAGTPSLSRGLRDRALVLGQMPSPLSTAVDVRAPARHLRAALGSLAAARPNIDVVLRPHPLDAAHGAYRRIAAQYPSLRVTISSEGPIEEAVIHVGLCVGAASTATLQAAALGRQSVLLDVTGVNLRWPFDGSGDFPAARGADELESLLGERSEQGREVALHALGARPDALERAADLVLRAVRG